MVGKISGSLVHQTENELVGDGQKKPAHCLLFGLVIQTMFTPGIKLLTTLHIIEVNDS